MKEDKREEVDLLREPGEGLASPVRDVVHEMHDEAAPLPPEAHGRIGKQLREVYSRLLAEPLPEKFVKLLEDLAKAEPQK